ncbi:hypothetical protein [Nostoc sp.]|uniref:hypothetical protein n=1 Tax=Nostoc sp. TaxID=1180 RepID=UPI002FF578F2
MKTCLKPAFRLSRSQSPTGNAVLEAPPPLLAAEPPRAAFPASGWKQGFNEVLKGFALKLTRMSIAVPLPRSLFT